jgi:hypothetical protein
MISVILFGSIEWVKRGVGWAKAALAPPFTRGG